MPSCLDHDGSIVGVSGDPDAVRPGRVHGDEAVADGDRARPDQCPSRVTVEIQTDAFDADGGRPLDHDAVGDDAQRVAAPSTPARRG